MQLADHRQGQRAPAVQNLIDAFALADDRLQILDRKTALLHAEFDGLDRAGSADGNVPGFIGLNQRGQDGKTISIRRACSGFAFIRVEISLRVAL